MFFSSIDNNTLDTLPNASLNTCIKVVATSAQLEEAVRYLSTQPVIGFDTETKPRFTAGRMYKPALLQFSSADVSYLIHLTKVGIPDTLADLLANPSVLKIGAAVKDDISGLQRYTPFTPGGFIDLQQMAESYGILDKSVRKLAGIVLGERVSKSQQVTNWEAYPLTEAQQHYAATDAYVCFRIYKTLLANPQEVKSPKKRLYEEVLKQLTSLMDGESNQIAILANAAAVFKENFHFWWVGFYFLDAPHNQLVLGPFQGPLACTRIPYGRGVCGKAWKEGKTIVVPDVSQFADHIACSSRSQSEIVVPLFRTDGTFGGVLDIDSERLGTFDAVDKAYLEEIARLFQKFV